MSEILKAFEANKGAIRTILSRYVRRSDEIEDLTQEVFLRGFSVEAEDEIREPKAYLLRIARNLGVNEVRKHANLFTDSLEDSGGSEVLEDERNVSAEDELDSKRKFALFCKALADLPAECREPLLLRKMEDLKFKQIATRLNLTVSTTEKRVARGLVLCKAYLRKHGYDLVNDDFNGVAKSGKAHKAAALKKGALSFGSDSETANRMTTNDSQQTSPLDESET